MSGAEPVRTGTRRPWLPRLLLGALALIIQLPVAVWLSVDNGVAGLTAAVRIAVAIFSPVLFVLLCKWPGPRAAVLAGLGLLDILVWAGDLGSAAAGSAVIGSAAAPASESGTGPWDAPGPWVEAGPWGRSGPWTDGGPWAPNPAEAMPVPAALLFALGAAVLRGSWVWALVSAGSLWLGALLLGPIVGVDWSVPRVASATIGVALALGIGGFMARRGIRRRAAVEAADRRQEEAAQSERLRIARELHDILGHSLSQINVQAGVGEHLIDRDPEQARRALAAIKELSSSGLDEVRAILRTMRTGDDTATGAQAENAATEVPLIPVRGVADLPVLITQISAAEPADGDAMARAGGPGTGTNPTIRLVDGVGEHIVEVPQAVSAAAFRIVQEALTNVIRHAHAASAEVRTIVEAGHLVVAIADDGIGVPSAGGAGNGVEGNGILGMRERAEQLGGTLTIGICPDGGTIITARLPLSRV